jgi:cytochrome c
MKTIIAGVATVAALMIAGSAMAADLPDVGKKKCGACHAVDKEKVGPAFNDISAKYKGDAEAVAKITASITKGGKFGWKTKSGSAMPPKGLGATDADIQVMAEFIAGLSK